MIEGIDWFICIKNVDYEKKMIKNLKKNYVLKCFCLYICVLYNFIVLMDKVLIVYLNLYLDVSERICVV